MYKIKQSPEDFIVKEITNIKIKDSGKYIICLLKKTSYTTIRAIEQIAKALNKKPKEIGFAGTKDRNAITEQYISIKNAKKKDVERVRVKDIEIKFVGYSDIPISLGDLKGNEFIITIKGLTNKEILSLKNMINKKIIMPNFFGEQRFSERNVEIGKSLIKSNFKETIKIILDTNRDSKEGMVDFLENNQNNYVGALKLMPKRLLRLYVHAYQSYLWNKTLEEYIKKDKKNMLIPIVGFGTEIEDKEIEKAINKIMKKEKITFRSFINRQFPELSSEGSLRDAFVKVEGIEIMDNGKDFVKIKFRLQKGSYATVAVEFLLV